MLILCVLYIKSHFCDYQEGNTALHWASFAGADELTEMFLSRGCDVQAVNIHGDTPL